MQDPAPTVNSVAMETTTESDPAGAVGWQHSNSISQDAPRQQSPPPKARKSAFKFFSGRKSICVLPSFFGGRAKSQGKGSCKTGVTKSQTYDGASRTCWEDLGRGTGVLASGDFEFCSSNDSNKVPEVHGKSQSLPRGRRGLRGLFSSIRRHRKSKNAEVEKCETLELSSSFRAKSVPVDLSSFGDKPADGRSEELEPDVPNSTTDTGIMPVAASECWNDASNVPATRRSVDCDGEEVECLEPSEKTAAGRLSRESTRAESEVKQSADVPDEEPGVSGSSENVNLMFGDVSSLKSFDSLTGCGDIIADQDEVCVTESSASAGRGGRNGGKRSSCFVTYQGGGEEMATPDEIDGEYLQSLWESGTTNEVCYLPSDRSSESPSLTPDQQVSSIRANSSSPVGIVGTALTPADLLSPQSDRQESVPNSDEGYYDSTTPGIDEEKRERPQLDRLPRDSYSGDALYELFEPDDRLLSPSLLPQDACPFGRGPLQSDKSPSPLYALASPPVDFGTMETEEERLSKIQHALLCCELPNLRSPSKDQLKFHSDRFFNDAGPQTTAENICPQSPSRPQGPNVPTLLGRSQVQDGDVFPPLSESGFSPPAPEPVQSPLPPNKACSQSQEELMVCFSQALVDFTKNRLYHNSTESLEGSESSSPFGPSLRALPAIVTFDVVDMENEGECEQQTELAEEEEELPSPFENFEENGCYLQQDAFAECDQRTFDACEQSLLLSNTWGITSLPRHLSSGRPCPQIPAPLALNRRSRSLDTDGLEFQTSEFYTSVTQYDVKGDVFSQRLTLGSNDIALPPSHRGTVDSWRQGSSIPHTLDPKLSRVSQPNVRPSHLPLKATCSNRTFVDGGDAEVVLGGGDALYPCSYPPSGAKWRNLPVGVTQGVPHLRPDQSTDQRDVMLKNRRVGNEVGLATAPKP